MAVANAAGDPVWGWLWAVEKEKWDFSSPLRHFISRRRYCHNASEDARGDAESGMKMVSQSDIFHRRHRRPHRPRHRHRQVDGLEKNRNSIDFPPSNAVTRSWKIRPNLFSRLSLGNDDEMGSSHSDSPFHDFTARPADTPFLATLETISLSPSFSPPLIRLFAEFPLVSPQISPQKCPRSPITPVSSMRLKNQSDRRSMGPSVSPSVSPALLRSSPQHRAPHPYGGPRDNHFSNSYGRFLLHFLLIFSIIFSFAAAAPPSTSSSSSSTSSSSRPEVELVEAIRKNDENGAAKILRFFSAACARNKRGRVRDQGGAVL